MRFGLFFSCLLVSMLAIASASMPVSASSYTHYSGISRNQAHLAVANNKTSDKAVKKNEKRATNKLSKITLDHPDLSATKPWGVLFYVGLHNNYALLKVLASNMRFDPTWPVFTVALSKELSPRNPVRRLLSYVFSTADIAVNGVYRDDINGPIYGVDAYLVGRWTHFPWNHNLLTTVGIGEGVSYNSRAPTYEVDQWNNDKPTKFLNYLMFELTFAAPVHPNIQFVIRIHHRSGVFGLYGPKSSGSTDVGLGVRFLFG